MVRAVADGWCRGSGRGGTTVIWDGLRGHGDVVELFRRAVGRNRLAHAYALVGPSGVGKFEFAKRLAACLVCSRHDDTDVEACGECNNCRQLLANSHPDVFVVACPRGKKTIPIASIVGSEERRGREGLCPDLSLRPMSARRRIAIIDDADRLSTESANALLKTLEEPPRDAVMFLVAEDFESLLPTIRSRCQPVRFGPLPDDDVAALLLEQGRVESAGEAAEVAAVAGGSLTVAGQLVDPTVRGMRDELRSGLSSGDFDPQTLAASIVAAVEGLGSDRQEQRRAAGWAVRFTVEAWRLGLREVVVPGTQAAVDSALVGRLRDTDDPVEVVRELLDLCDAANRRLEGNSPVPLVLETLFDGIGRTLRRRTRAVEGVRPVQSGR